MAVLMFYKHSCARLYLRILDRSLCNSVIKQREDISFSSPPSTPRLFLFARELMYLSLSWVYFQPPQIYVYLYFPSLLSSWFIHQPRYISISSIITFSLASTPPQINICTLRHQTLSHSLFNQPWSIFALT